jgi:hypothetical protein
MEHSLLSHVSVHAHVAVPASISTGSACCTVRELLYHTLQHNLPRAMTQL